MFERTPSGLQGEAEFATLAQKKAAGFYTPKGQVIGYDAEARRALYASSDHHIFTLAPPGSFKTVGTVINSLLENSGNMVVTDAKAALAPQTARHRAEKFGHKIVILNPWQEELAASGVEIETTPFNPLSILKKGDPSLIDNAEMLAEMLCPTRHDAKDPDWTRRAASILVGCLLYLVHAKDEVCTLPRLYSLVRDTREGWEELATLMQKVDGIDLTDYATEILAPLVSEKQWSGYESAMHNATKIYNPQKPLGRHVSENGFDLDDLLNEDMTLYIVAPSNRRKANRDWLSLVLGLCAETIGKPSSNTRPVTLLCEEFANLGYMPSIINALAEYREAGLRGHLIVQTLEHLYTLYGQNEANALIKTCGIRQFFGVDDINVAREIEQVCGTFTAFAQSTNSRLDAGTTTSEIAVPLFRAQDIMNLHPLEQIIIMRGNCPVMKEHIRPFFFDQAKINALDPNPYRNDPEDRIAKIWSEWSIWEAPPNAPFTSKPSLTPYGIAMCILLPASSYGMSLIQSDFLDQTLLLNIQLKYFLALLISYIPLAAYSSNLSSWEKKKQRAEKEAADLHALHDSLNA